MSRKLPRERAPRRAAPRLDSAWPARGRGALAYVLLIGLSSIAYVNAGHPEFFFDSAGALIENPRTVDLPGTLRRLCLSPWSADEQFSHLTFALNYAINRALGRPGFEVAGFLVFNVLVHALNTCLLYTLLRGLCGIAQPDGARPVAVPLVLAALFAVHPLHASSVAYIAQRRGMLATTFCLLGALTYLRWRRGWHPTPVWRSGGLGLILVLCWWLSFRSKSVGLTLPVVLLSLEFCLRAPDRAVLRRYLRYLVPGAVVCLALMVVFLWSRGLLDLAHLRILPYGHAEVSSPWAHFLTESRVFVQYWKLLLLPLPGWMSIDHDFAVSNSLREHGAFMALAFHAVVLAMGVYAARHGYTLAAAGIFWFYATLLPYALVPQSELFVEYKTYLSSIGLILVLAELISRWAARAGPRPAVVTLAVVAAVLLSLTLHRNRIYQSTAGLWADAVTKYPHRLRPRVNLGTALARQGRTDEAIEQFKAALQILPNSYTAHTGLGLALVEKGRLADARPHYEAALAVKPDYADVHINLAILLAQQGMLDEANMHYKEVLRTEPDNAKAHNNLAVNLARQGRSTEALDHFATALRLNPEYAEAYFNLALTLVKEGRLVEAVAHYQAAIRLDAQYAPAYYKLGEALALQGKTADAVAQYQRALQIKPDFAEAHYGLGQALENMGRIEEAGGAYRQVLRWNPEHAGARARLEALAGNRASGQNPSQ